MAEQVRNAVMARVRGHLSVYRAAWGRCSLRFIDASREPWLTYIGYAGIMIREQSNREIMSLALHQGSEQYVALDELAVRLREDRSNWWTSEWDRIWNPLGVKRELNAIEIEWALLELSQLYNGDAEGQATDYALIGKQDRRHKEIGQQLDETENSLEMDFFNHLQECIRKNRT